MTIKYWLFHLFIQLKLPSGHIFPLLPKISPPCCKPIKTLTNEYKPRGFSLGFLCHNLYYCIGFPVYPTWLLVLVVLLQKAQHFCCVICRRSFVHPFGISLRSLRLHREWWVSYFCFLFTWSQIIECFGFRHCVTWIQYFHSSFLSSFAFLLALLRRLAVHLGSWGFVINLCLLSTESSLFLHSLRSILNVNMTTHIILYSHTKCQSMHRSMWIHCSQNGSSVPR